jgi:hypothetical protein
LGLREYEKSLSRAGEIHNFWISCQQKKKKGVWERGEGECRGRKGVEGGRKEERGKRKASLQ